MKAVQINEDWWFVPERGGKFFWSNDSGYMYVEAGGDISLSIGRIEDFEEFLIKCGYTLVRSQEDSFQTKKMLVDGTEIYYREEDINSDKEHIGYYYNRFGDQQFVPRTSIFGQSLIKMVKNNK